MVNDLKILSNCRQNEKKISIINLVSLLITSFFFRFKPQNMMAHLNQSDNLMNHLRSTLLDGTIKMVFPVEF